MLSFGLFDPYVNVSWLRLEVMKGIKKVEVEIACNRKECLPISPLILTKLREAWSTTKDEYNTKILWAVCCLSFFLHSSVWRGDSAQ